jgi:anti-sigma B factor antagonist
VTTDEQERVRVAAIGELDLAVAPRFERALREAEADRPRTLVIDLSAIEFLDSTGLNVIVNAYRRAATENRDLIVVEAPPHVQKIFTVTQLDRVLTFVQAP